MDIVDKETRSRIMAAVRSKDTAPEVSLRRALFRAGFRYRLHRRDLPGKPDMVFPKHHAVVFVNGCFWHYHGCRETNIPTTRRRWWRGKLEGNRRRDAAVLSGLREAGWRTVVVWECSFKRADARGVDLLAGVARRVAAFLPSKRSHLDISGHSGLLAGMRIRNDKP